MELHEVKIGDLVSYKDKRNRMVKGKVVHRFEADDKPHLAGHVNVQSIDKSAAYPKTIHVSNLTPCFEEGTSMEFSSLKENIAAMLADIRNGENMAATEKFNDILSAKVDEVIMSAKVDVANALFNPESVDEEFIDDAEEIEFLTQEEFDTLSDEEQAEFEAIELDADQVDEALIGGQKKIDANKNGKLDAQDFKMLRAKKGMKNEAYTDPYAAKKAAEMKKAHSEKISGIKKEFDSDKTLPNPFMKLKKRDPRNRFEEVEQMDELTKKTLGSYVKKAVDSVAKNSSTKGISRAKSNFYGAGTPGDPYGADWRDSHDNKADSLQDKVWKRKGKISQAVDKLTKEQVELMDEGNAENKAKKNAFVSTLSKKGYTNMLKKGRDTLKGDPYAIKHANKMKAALSGKENAAFDQEIKAQKAKQNEEVQPVNEKLTDAVKKVMKSALTHNVPKDTKKTSAQARAMIKIAKMNPANTVRKEDVELEEAAKACKECGEKLSSEKQMKSGYCCSDCMPKGSLKEGHFDNKPSQGAKVEPFKGKSLRDKLMDPEFREKYKKDMNKMYGIKEPKNEEVEQIDEVITKSTPTDEVVSDFVHSKNPKFAGKSKKERIRMALGAKYAMMKNEGIDLQELDADTLRSYIAKRAKPGQLDAARKGDSAAKKQVKGISNANASLTKKYSSKLKAASDNAAAASYRDAKSGTYHGD